MYRMNLSTEQIQDVLQIETQEDFDRLYSTLYIVCQKIQNARQNINRGLNENQNREQRKSRLPHIPSDCFKELIDYKMVSGVLICMMCLVEFVGIVTNILSSPPTERRYNTVFSCIDSQKWSKGKTRDTVDNKVYFEQADYDKLLAEVPKVRIGCVSSHLQMKLITVYTIVDRLKINGSCARAGIRELVKQGQIVEVSKRGHFILTRK